MLTCLLSGVKFLRIFLNVKLERTYIRVKLFISSNIFDRMFGSFLSLDLIYCLSVCLCTLHLLIYSFFLNSFCRFESGNISWKIINYICILLFTLQITFLDVAFPGLSIILFYVFHIFRLIVAVL